MKELGLYIHIPFCKQKCLYCDFYSMNASEELIDRYFNALIKEIKDVGKNVKDTIIKTIYIGGGTPSYVNCRYIIQTMQTIRDFFSISEEAEITIEVNPGSASLEKLKNYTESGINRISIGMQSINNTTLKTIGRIHSWEDFKQTYNFAREAGFKNINIDCMIGLPNQNMQEIEETAKEIIKLNPEHVSVYSLIIEENTQLEKLVSSGQIKLPEENEEREMYWYIKQSLEENGYNQYEISNFSKPNYESKHNLDCWHQKEYIGMGVAAHSYTDGCRYSNINDINKYIKNYEVNKQEDNIIIHEVQDKTSMAKEYIMLSLRTIKGCNINEFYNKFGYDIQKGFKNEFEKLLRDELICIDNTNIYLSKKGLDLANQVWQEFI